MKFYKYQGIGNDFIVVEGRHNQFEAFLRTIPQALIRRLCDRNFGVGADGLIFVLPAEGDGEVRMRIFNSDGSEAEMCGNGIRCMTSYLAINDLRPSGYQWEIETKAGIIRPSIDADGKITVDMGKPFLEPERVPTKFTKNSNGLPQGVLDVVNHQFEGAAVGMGNPHLVIPVINLKDIQLQEWGRSLECNEAFPAKTNVHFVEVLDRSSLKVLVWERGSGPTLACGTGACAVLVATYLLGLSDNQCDIHLPGGTLNIYWEDIHSTIKMKGPAELVFDGSINI